MSDEKRAKKQKDKTQEHQAVVVTNESRCEGEETACLNGSRVAAGVPRASGQRKSCEW